MLQVNFNKLITQLPELTDCQSYYLEKLLKSVDLNTHIIRELEQRMENKPECLHCHCSLINRHGKVNGIKRF